MIQRKIALPSRSLLAEPLPFDSIPVQPLTLIFSGL